MESKTKSGYSVIQMVEIPEKSLSKGILRQLSGREIYTDTDDDLGECVYDGSVFEAIAGEQAEMSDSPLAMSAEDIAKIDELAEELGEYELVRINKI